MADVFEMATRPVVVSHSGVKAVCGYNRNLTDDQLEKLAANDGVIGIGYWDAAVCDDSPARIIKVMNHVRDLVGIEHIALGSDFDGGVATRFDTSELAVLTQALIDAGYSEADIRAVIGGQCPPGAAGDTALSSSACAARPARPGLRGAVHTPVACV